MSPSLIYRNALLYEALMFSLYGPAYFARYAQIAELIPAGATVTDLCCGPATLYHRHLKAKNVRYTGLDINPAFAADLCGKGATGLHWDMAETRPLPRADYVLMQASLYHFLPDCRPVIDRMLGAASRQVLVAEPVRNLADSPSPLLAWLARKFTDPGTGEQPHRFNEARLDALFAPYGQAGYVQYSRLIAGGREKLYVLKP